MQNSRYGYGIFLAIHTHTDIYVYVLHMHTQTFIQCQNIFHFIEFLNVPFCGGSSGHSSTHRHTKGHALFMIGFNPI